jgi:sigma-E factor negative regulatory protein RseB
LLLLLAVAGQALSQEQARQWLDLMANAVQNLDYDGTFVYLHDGKLEAMRIIHARDDLEGERERLVSLTGSAREVLRNNESVTCILPDSKSVMVERSRPRQPFPVVPRDLESLQEYYRFETIGDDRIAGYMTRVIAIIPRDAFRYGYRFWIDKDSKMFLRSEMSDADNRPIEQVMFTRLDIGGGIPDVDLEASLTGDGYTWYRHASRGAAADTGDRKPRWSVRRLPSGFVLANYQRKPMRPNGKETEHMVYSDGLATVSVYVEHPQADAQSFTGLSSMGAINAYGAVVDGYQVTVVGEVPAVTVEMMARSVSAIGERHDD